MPRPPEQPPQPEVSHFPFLLASRFDSRETSQAPYDTIQAIVRDHETAEFSVFRMIQIGLKLSRKPRQVPNVGMWLSSVIPQQNHFSRLWGFLPAVWVQQAKAAQLQARLEVSQHLSLPQLHELYTIKTPRF